MLSLRYHLLCKCGMQILEVHLEVFPICLCFRIRSHTIRSPLPLMENCCGKCVVYVPEGKAHLSYRISYKYTCITRNNNKTQCDSPATTYDIRHSWRMGFSLKLKRDFVARALHMPIKTTTTHTHTHATQHIHINN